jgi:hypothetical protein
MFATKKFRDVFSFQGPGIPPQLYATGSVAGTAIQVAAAGSLTGNLAGFKKWVFIGQTGSGGATTLWNAWIAAGSGSAGSASIILPATSTSTFSGSNSFAVGSAGSVVFGSQANIVMEIRGEYIAGLGSNFSWIRPVMSITGASAYAALLSLGFVSGSEPASNYDIVGAVFAETDAF